MNHNRRNIQISAFLLLLVLSSSLAACQGESRTITISSSGAFALYPMMVRWGEEYQRSYPDVQFDISAGGAGKGMLDALSGAVDIGMVSRDIKQEETDKGAFGVAVAKDAVFPVISSKNPYAKDLLEKGLSQEVFRKIFVTGEITTWGEALGKPQISDKIHVYTRSDACGAAEVWVKYLGGKNQEELKGVGISGDPGLLDAVIKDNLGIGYNNLNYVFDASTGKPVEGSLALPIDTDNNHQINREELLQTKQDALTAVRNGTYPSPPARELYLVTKGAPQGAVKDFLIWVLADGQKYLSEAGYISLPQNSIETELAKFK